MTGSDVLRIAEQLRDLFARISAVTVHLKRNNGSLTLKELSDCTSWINDAINEYKRDELHCECEAGEDCGATIQDVRNGSVDCTFLVSFGVQVAAEVIAGLILKIGEYVWNKMIEKFGRRNDKSAADMIDPEANKINVVI